MKKLLLIGIGIGIGCSMMLATFLVIDQHTGLTNYSVPLFGVRYDHVRIDFINESNEKVKSVRINDLFSIGEINPGERKIAIFPHSGEGTYACEVLFESGREVKSTDRYIEGGYFQTEHIYSDSVEVEY